MMRLLLFLFLLPLPLMAQDLPEEELEENASDVEEYLLWLEDLRVHPLDINRASASTLARLPGVTRSQAVAVVYRRKHVRPFHSVDELLEIPGFTAELLDVLRPYLRVGSVLEHQLIGLHRVRFQRELPAGTGSGVPVHLFQRLTYRFGERVGVYVTMEQDMGEAFRWKPAAFQLGWDHLTVSAEIRPGRTVRRVIVGDYRVTVGRGLVLWQGFGMGKGRAVVEGAGQWGRGMTPYRSSTESGFMRGMAIELQPWEAISLVLMGSHRRLDARLEGTEVRGLVTDGYHRTEVERMRRGTLGETWFGALLRVVQGVHEVDLVMHRTVYDRPFAPEPVPEYRYAFRGRHRWSGSLSGRFQVGRGLLSMEAALVEGRHAAFSGALEMALRGSWRGIWLVRMLPASFYALHGRTFQEVRGVPTNEWGSYLGVEVRPAPAWRIRAYMDVYAFPWLRLKRESSGGQDALLEVHYRQGRRWEGYGLLRMEHQERLLREDSLVQVPTPTRERLLRLRGHIRLFLSRKWWTATRLEGVLHTRVVREPGIMGYQEWGWETGRLRGSVRVTYFHTEPLIYAYERDVPGAFRMAVMQGRGYRVSGVLRYVTPHIEMAVRFERTGYLDGRRTIGSGWQRVEGSVRHTVGIQVAWRL